jgi:uncharacterized protein
MRFAAPHRRRAWHAHAAHALGALLLAGSLAARAQPAPAACPPVTQPPTPAQVQAAQETARDRGFLWRISKDGRNSWLYGTMHLGKLDWVFPGPNVRAALGATDLIALELDVTDPAVAQAVATWTAGPAEPVALPPALRDRLARQEEAACLPPGALDSQHPVLRAITLVLLAARWEGLDAGYGQELALALAARGSKRPLVSLETVALQMGTLIPSDPAQATEMVATTLDQLESGAARKVSARLAETWALGRLDELEQYERWCECVASAGDRAFLRRVNDDRNLGLAERIDALHGAGQRVFAAVGALHMTGPQALPALMAQRGYVVERIVFTR